MKIFSVLSLVPRFQKTQSIGINGESSREDRSLLGKTSINVQKIKKEEVYIIKNHFQRHTHLFFCEINFGKSSFIV